MEKHHLRKKCKTNRKEAITKICKNNSLAIMQGKKQCAKGLKTAKKEIKGQCYFIIFVNGHLV